MKKIILKSLFLALLIAGVGHEVEAGKSTTATVNNIPTLAYWWNWAPVVGVGQTVSLSQETTCGKYCGWARALANTNSSVVYTNRLINLANNQEINDGASLPVGTKFKVERVTTVADIAWNGTGYSSDSPYGNFAPGAGPSAFSCMTWNYVGKYSIYDAHIMLTVAPPNTNVFSDNGNATCDANGVCEVKKVGPISVGMHFPATYGRFYYRYWEYRNYSDDGFTFVPGCHANNVPMRKATGSVSNSGNTNVEAATYDVPFPQATNTFYLTGVAAAPTYIATCQGVTVPSGITPGSKFSAQVTYRNDGNQTWDAGNGYRLNKASITGWGKTTHTFTGSVAPGATRTFTVDNLTAPSTPGTYDFAWRMNVYGFDLKTPESYCGLQVTVTAPAYKCLGTLPANTVPHNLDGQKDTSNLGSDTSKSYSEDNTPAQCEYTCDIGFERQGSACVAIPGSCMSPEANASFWDIEEQTDVPYANYESRFTNDDNVNKKCEYRCDLGYSKKGGACVADTTNSCVGVIPENAEVYSAQEETDLTESIDWKYEEPNAFWRPGKCRFNCIDWHSWDGYSCNPSSLPDLVPSLPTASPIEVKRGETVNFSGEITNKGGARAGRFNVGNFGIRRVGENAASDVTPATPINGNTEVGQTRTTTGSWTIPATDPIGTRYQISYWADFDREVYEGVDDYPGSKSNWSGWGGEFILVEGDTTTMCGGSIDPNAVQSSVAEEVGVTSGTNWTHSSSDTTAKCEFTCNLGFNWDNTAKACAVSKYDLEASTPTAGPSSNPDDIDKVTGVYNNVRVLMGIKNVGGKIVGAEGISYKVTLEPLDGSPTISSDALPIHDEDIQVGDEASVTRTFDGVPFGTYEVCTTVNLDPKSTTFTEDNYDNNDTKKTGKCSIVTLTTTPPPVMEINSSKKFIRAEPGEAVNIDWRVRAPYDMQCTVKGPGGVNISFSTTATTLESATTKGNEDSTVLKNTGVYTLICERTGSTDRYKETVTVEAVPGQPEI